MHGVGIDLLEIERLERALERRPALAARLFTDAERAYARAARAPGQHLAARFCAKEAVAKALGLDVCARTRSRWSATRPARPSVRLQARPAPRAGARRDGRR